MTYDPAGVEKASRDLLVAIGEDPEREGLIGTPDRMARAWREMCSGLFEDPREHLRTQFHAGTDELVLVRDITFHSSSGLMPTGWPRTTPGTAASDW